LEIAVSTYVFTACSVGTAEVESPPNVPSIENSFTATPLSRINVPPEISTESSNVDVPSTVKLPVTFLVPLTKKYCKWSSFASPDREP